MRVAGEPLDLLLHPVHRLLGALLLVGHHAALHRQQREGRAELVEEHLDHRALLLREVLLRGPRQPLLERVGEQLAHVVAVRAAAALVARQLELHPLEARRDLLEHDLHPPRVQRVELQPGVALRPLQHRLHEHQPRLAGHLHLQLREARLDHAEQRVEHVRLGRVRRVAQPPLQHRVAQHPLRAARHLDGALQQLRVPGRLLDLLLAKRREQRRVEELRDEAAVVLRLHRLVEDLVAQVDEPVLLLVRHVLLLPVVGRHLAERAPPLHPGLVVAHVRAPHQLRLRQLLLRPRPPRPLRLLRRLELLELVRVHRAVDVDLVDPAQVEGLASDPHVEQHDEDRPHRADGEAHPHDVVERRRAEVHVRHQREDELRKHREHQHLQRLRRRHEAADLLAHARVRRRAARRAARRDAPEDDEAPDAVEGEEDVRCARKVLGHQAVAEGAGRRPAEDDRREAGRVHEQPLAQLSLYVRGDRKALGGEPVCRQEILLALKRRPDLIEGGSVRRLVPDEERDARTA